MWVWSILLLIAWTVSLVAKSDSAADEEWVRPISWDGEEISVVDLTTGDLLPLFVDGETTAVAIVSMRCAVCRTNREEILSRLNAFQVDRRLLVTIDSPEQAALEMERYSQPVSLHRLSTGQRKKLKLRSVPLFVVEAGRKELAFVARGVIADSVVSRFNGEMRQLLGQAR